MKNTTTLSLITAAILGLTGCGPTDTNPVAETLASSLINANSTGNLENKQSLETAVEIALEKNTNKLKANGLKDDIAKQESKKFTSTALGKLNLDDLEAAILTECNEDEKCKEMAYASFTGALTEDKEEAYAMFTDGGKEMAYAVNLILDKEMAYAIAEEIRDNDKEEAYAILENDTLVKEFTCQAGEIRTVQHYGIEDLFDTSNGVESTSPNPTTALLPSLVAYNNNVNAGFSTYDHVRNDRLFLEDIKNLPTGITSGRFYIGLKSNGSSLQVNDTMSIGDLTATGALNTQARYAAALTDLSTDGWSNQLVNSSNPTTDIYWNDFANISFFNGQSLLDHVQTNTRFDAYVQDDTSVDFITVATCSVKDPIKEIKEVVNKFECNEKQGKIFTIIGGEIDALATGTDTATPSSSLENIALGNTVYPTVANYDYTSYDHHFVDTLTLPTNYTVTKAEFNIGYKVIGSSLHTNDAIYIGDINGSNGNYAGGHLFDNNNNILTQPNWTVTNISNGEKVANVDLAILDNNSGQATGKVKTTMTNKGYLDVYVQDDTAVDFTQLNLCVLTKKEK